MVSELNAPLGKKPKKPSDPSKYAKTRPWVLLSSAVACTILIAGVVGFVLLRPKPTPPPAVEVAIQSSQRDNPFVISIEQPADAVDLNAPDDNSPQTSGPSFLSLDSTPTLAEQHADELNSLGSLSELTETSEYGPLPIISASGLTPFTAYSRPSVTLNTAGGRALIAVVVTGLGLNQSTTTDAISNLPGPITLSFAPYGDNLEQSAKIARDNGHETMLELPFEPFNYPQNDPGPHTLQTGVSVQSNIDKLSWLLARFPGYSGVMNYMGARLTSSEKDFEPILAELDRRGLSYLDDGTSERSLGASLSAKLSLPHAKSDIELDKNPSREAILAELNSAQTLAKSRGYAVVHAAALPISIRTLAEWSQNLDDKEYILVPLSAISSQSDNRL